MTSDSPIPPGNGSGAILRALGSLMAALGGEAGRPGQQPLEYVYEPQREAYRAPGTSPATPQRPAPRVEAPRGAIQSTGRPEVESLLSDARQRAESILQESMERANELLSRERPVPAGNSAEVEALRRSVDDLVNGMRDVQARVARIESILGPGRATPAAVPPMPSTPAAPPAAPPARPAFAPPVEEERRPGGLSVVSPQAPAPPRPPAPPLVPPSAVPPMRGGGQPAAAQAPLRAEPEPERPAPPERFEAPAAQAWERDDSDDAAGTLATFTPGDGAVQLRAAPVSGFQGLMRLQDALQRIPAVRAATVEAYSQGEARLRLELAADVDSDEIAEGLGAGLGQNAVVQEASEEERSITIAFG